VIWARSSGREISTLILHSHMERLPAPVAFVSTVKLRKAGFNAAVDTRDALCAALQSFIDRKLLPPARQSLRAA
jgi:hypothetical protein